MPSNGVECGDFLAPPTASANASVVAVPSSSDTDSGKGTSNLAPEQVGEFIEGFFITCLVTG